MADTSLEIRELTDAEKALIRMLRSEASEVKDCFTRFSFQALAFTAPVLAIIANFTNRFSVVAVGSSAVVSLILAVARIGTYKYATANRNFGYELHLHRTASLSESTEDGWKLYMRKIGWEEAIRAWRIVQATVFEHLYYSRLLYDWIELPNYLKLCHREPLLHQLKRQLYIRCRCLRFRHRQRLSQRLKLTPRHKRYEWFNPSQQIVQGSAYHAGSYLETMLRVLHTLALLATTPLIWATVNLYRTHNIATWKLFLATSFCVLLLAFIFKNIIKDNARRKLLEGGLLCIHSSAIMWQAVVLAHYKALRRI